MVTDQEIANCVESLLRQSPGDPSLINVTTSSGSSSTTSPPTININGVVQQLEARLGLSLTHKTGFIRDHISLLLRPPTPKDHFALTQQQQQQQQQQHHHQQQQQQQQQFLQRQYMESQHQIMQHHQIQQSPFTHLPHQHELTFRCAPTVQMPQKQQQHQVSVASTVVMPKLDGNVGSFATGSSVPVPTSAPPAPPAKGSGQPGAKRRGGPGGLNKICAVSPELQTIVGEPTMARTQIVKQLWAYIRKNNLQDPNNKRKIICNDELRLVFETDCTDMFKMNKLLAKHIMPLEPTKDSGPDLKKAKTSESVSKTDSLTVPVTEPVDVLKTVPVTVPLTESVIRPLTEPVIVSVTEPLIKHDGLNHPVALSDALIEFFGTGEREMLQSEALKRIWDYIKVNQLEDPSNTMVIQFDAKLHQLFGCESLPAIGVSEMLSQHLFKQS
ncbi:SWIB/MDM2 domain containing protein [Zostera marina]|uniref:SWIB/MDM2 domain containing protein n=1 Tax=Zostera marina TaxID=29655 RepID=A0A0K9PGY2_ZOSMR|nr:SWIB/MDM2 domain containing protein [Zostera marina]